MDNYGMSYIRINSGVGQRPKKLLVGKREREWIDSPRCFFWGGGEIKSKVF